MNIKPVVYWGSSKKDISHFDTIAKQRILHLLDMLRVGLDLCPNDFKYMGIVGEGVYELRVRINVQYRIFYIAKFNEAIYVLHAFIKKEQKTLLHDIAIGRKRYKAVIAYSRGIKL